MHVVEVIPLVRGTHVETLSYYSSYPYAPGSIITIPVRNQEKRAIVLSAQPVSTAKTALRAATFSLKKLPPQENVKSIPPLLIATAQQLSGSVPASVGAILHSLLPKEVLTGAVELEYTIAPERTAIKSTEVSILQGTHEDRFRTYRSRIRETFAHRGSVLFVVPTSADLARTKAFLEGGIESRIVTFSASFTARALKDSYHALHDLSHAKLIITTPSHAFLDRHDITDIIIDQSRSRAYKSRFRPYLDIRDCLKVMAGIDSRRLLLGDLVPRTEDEYLRREDIYGTEDEEPKRISFLSDFSVIEHKPERTASVKFELFAPAVNELIKETFTEKKHLFIYAARRGIAPVVTCMDCGHIFRCPDSGAPYSLFKTVKNGEEQRWFLASASGKRIRAADTCEVCGSWRLRERGIGIQHIHEELRSTFPHIPVTLFDHTTATSARRATQLVGDFYEKRGAILLGTAMALPYLTEPVSYTLVSSLDAARAVPTWRADEELFALLMTLREKATEQCIVQTRTAPDEVLSLAKSGNIEQFYHEELALRAQLSYPPYCTFVHLTLQGTAPAVATLEAQVSERLLSFSPRFYHAPTTTSAKAIRYGLIRVPRGSWPDRNLIDTLRSLPPSVRIEINPDRLV
jgi:primosomal protein N'